MNTKRAGNRHHTSPTANRARLRGRVRSLAITIALVGSFTLPPITPAEAAALWTRHAPTRLQAPSQPDIDPAYSAPAKHGVNYVAPTARPKAAAPGGSFGSEKLNLRTSNSRTFSSGGRQLTTLVYPNSVNYRDAT